MPRLRAVFVDEVACETRAGACIVTRSDFLTRIGAAVAKALQDRMLVQGLGVFGGGEVVVKEHEALGELVAAAILSCGFIIADPVTETQLANRRSDAQ